MTGKLLLYTGLLGDGITEKPTVWVTVDGKAFLGCPKRCIEPLKFSEPDNLSCPVCNWETTTEEARGVLAGILGHLIALYAMVGECDPVESIRAILLGEEKEQTDVAHSNSHP